ncbi:uncharacterized protein LOC128878221 [Hylaeus volcanicus]|uniref:uncharacterized protein LOC128878221 n=1 Tax=Hylaeus volcanicus TaxID=313075 RepID=UPI0023B78E80|nr:uncharacterized protein LOC128878221 [Hylaeus volcanicus]
MKSLLIFVPDKLYKEKPGYMFGKVVYDDSTGVKKFYVIGICRTDNFETIKHGTSIIGYYSAAEHKRGYVDKKYVDWINIYSHPNFSLHENNYDYSIKSIIVNNKKMSTLHCHTVITVYDQVALRETELFGQRATSGNHFYELMKILQSKQVEGELQKKGKVTYIKETLLVYHMFLYFYPVLLLSKVTSKLLPILKYSFLGLHVHGWLENVKWMLIAIIKNKRFTLKTGNYVFALIIDMLLGIFILQLLLHYFEYTSPSQILLSNAEKVVTFLKDLINWLMGVPAGLKLNHALNNMLGKFFLYHIHLWWIFLITIKPVMDFAFEVLVLFGRLGITFQIAIAADLLGLVSFHAYCIYVYAARLFNIQLKGITALFRLFLGKKMNPLRERVDSCQYQPDQLFVGTLLFTILLFLMPTTWVYYAVFTMLRLALIGFGGFLSRMKFYLQVMPVYTLFKWLFQSHNTRSIVNIKVHSHRAEAPIVLIMTLVGASWCHTWDRCIPDTIGRHPPIEWKKIISNIIWDLNNKRNCNTDASQESVDQMKEINEQNMICKKRKQRKQKSSNSNLNGTHKETMKDDEQENNFDDIQKDQDEIESRDELISSKKFRRTDATNADNNVEDTEEASKSEAKKPKQPSKRQLKREKAEKKETEKREASRLEAMKKGLSYVSQWKYAQSEWKFEKLRQIWLIDNLLDETSIPDDIFPTVLEYFEGCKGMAREQLLKKGLDVIKKVEENEEMKDEIESVAYQRARKLLQALPTET